MHGYPAQIVSKTNRATDISRIGTPLKPSPMSRPPWSSGNQGCLTGGITLQQCGVTGNHSFQLKTFEENSGLV